MLNEDIFGWASILLHADMQQWLLDLWYIKNMLKNHYSTWSTHLDMLSKEAIKFENNPINKIIPTIIYHPDLSSIKYEKCQHGLLLLIWWWCLELMHVVLSCSIYARAATCTQRFLDPALKSSSKSKSFFLTFSN